ncbi:MAG: FAD-dependent oxidoreductase [candidate division WOR-3 bacterium]|nr:MAG: FAD-dependent oxidoreductase [candidate division WOR-3 bacterium]
MKRIGVFICHCGRNISTKVDIEQLVKDISTHPGVEHCEDYKYLCSDPGQVMIKEKLREKKLDAIVVASCSPLLHEVTFRRAIQDAGLNPYLLEMANIREQCSWIHDDGKEATRKASGIIKATIEKVKYNDALEPAKIPVNTRALVLGGGIAGIQAALDIANSGYEVVLVEKSPSVGGHMAQLSETFPTLDCSQCILTPKMVDVSHHEKIKLYTYSEVEEVAGSVGNFRVKIRRKASFVDNNKCNGCADCDPACPVLMVNEFDSGLSQRKAIYRPFPQAVPNVYTIDKRGVPPCRTACPAGVNVQGYVALSSQGKFKEALALEREDNPFASVCGRVCTHPCESECKRAEFGDAVSIRAIKRFISDVEEQLPAHDKPEERKKKVAVVGAGPSGLSCAYFLAKRGYKAKVFEALPVAGGMLITGIPEFRLPRKMLEQDIDYIKSWGVEIVTGQRIEDPEKLRKSGFDAVYLSSGAHVERRLNVDGEDLQGVYYGIDFLRRANLEEKPAVGSRVTVVGGGNSAIDAARTALRLGAKEVTIVYRRSLTEMPADPDEIEEAMKEGIEIRFLATPISFVGSGGTLKEMKCIQMRLGAPDESGRRRPEPIPGSDFTIGVDTVVVTIGQSPDLSYLPAGTGIETSEWGSIVVDDTTKQTSIPGVFAGGDAVRGPDTVIWAIADGKEAAVSIDRYFNGADMYENRARTEPVKNIILPRTIKDNLRQEVRTLSAADRTGNFDEVNLGLTAEQTKIEALRCFACGGCTECGECEKACEQDAIVHGMEDELVEEEVGAVIVATGYELYPVEKIREYGAGRYEDVIDGLQFERLLSASGPTQGEIRRPSDNSIPKRIAFISCAGSRDPEHHLPYCSKICCMYNTKHALLYKERVPDGEAVVFSIDIRTAGKDYEEFFMRAKEGENVLYIRGKPSRVIKDGKDLIVWSTDTLTGRPLKVKCDMVVLSMAVVPSMETSDLAKKLRIQTNIHGFFNEAHPKLRPVESLVPGFFLAGCAQTPKDIPESVAQASAAASKALEMFSKKELTAEPMVVVIDEEMCSGCKMCVVTCPYEAREIDEEKNIVRINEALCMGCGCCVAACPSGASQQKNLVEKQISKMVEVILGE